MKKKIYIEKLFFNQLEPILIKYFLNIKTDKKSKIKE